MSISRAKGLKIVPAMVLSSPWWSQRRVFTAGWMEGRDRDQTSERTVWFSASKSGKTGACCWPLIPFRCRGHGRVELYLYPPFWATTGPVTGTIEMGPFNESQVHQALVKNKGVSLNYARRSWKDFYFWNLCVIETLNRVWVDVSSSAEHIRQKHLLRCHLLRSYDGHVHTRAEVWFVSVNFIGLPKRMDLEGSVPPGYDDAKLRSQLPTFRRNTSPSSSMILWSKRALRAFATPETDCPVTRRHIPNKKK